MQRELLEQLREITDEERRILNGEAEVDKDLYTSGSDFTIDSRKMLEEGKLIAVRTHTRFVHFPVHRHNYVEFMYVGQGEITHVIDGIELILYKGDLLMLNQYVEHAIHRAEFEDIGINFIALPEFFEIPVCWCVVARRQSRSIFWVMTVCLWNITWYIGNPS